MKPAHRFRNFALAVLLALPGLSGCMDKGAATAPPRSDNASAAPQDDAEASELTGAEINPNRKGSGDGWRWQGKRDACRFRVDKQCFDKRADACAAAGCAGAACVASDAVPAEVSCEGAEQ